MPKRVVIETFDAEDHERIAQARKSFQDQHDAARDEGRPDRFRFVFETDAVDQCVFDASHKEIYKAVSNVHVLVSVQED